MVRRPEDIGLTPDPINATLANPESLSPDNQDLLETHFTLSEALKTKAFWILAAFSVSGFMVQSGVSLHQVPHFIGQGVAPSLAVFAASTFALSQVIGGIIWSTLANRFKVRFLLASAGLAAGIGAIGTSNSSSIQWGLVASLCLGIGVGGLHLLLRLTWADYYGRRHLGSIRGVAHSAQIGGQVIGPILAGFMFDITKSYKLPFAVFTILLWGMSLLVLGATPPQKYQSSGDST
jgi:MFS family permease